MLNTRTRVLKTTSKGPNSTFNVTINITKGFNKDSYRIFRVQHYSILYQRGVYPAEDFVTVKKYDLTLLKTHDDELKDYIHENPSTSSQVASWNENAIN